METIYTRYCDYCHRAVDVGEGLVESSVWFHDSCYLSIMGKKEKTLRRKITNGQITAQEAKEYDEILILIQNIQKSEKGESLNNIINSSTPILKGSACKNLGLNQISTKINIKRLKSPQDEPQTIKIGVGMV